MKKFSQCLLCKYVFGRTCKKDNKVIDDKIYKNEIECKNFSSLNDEELYVDDSCCNENSKYYEI